MTTYTIEVTAAQDDIPVRGNAMASGDDATDRECEDDILTRLDSGDVWGMGLRSRDRRVPEVWRSRRR